MLKHPKSVKSVDAGEDFFFVQEVRSANGWQIIAHHLSTWAE